MENLILNIVKQIISDADSKSIDRDDYLSVVAEKLYLMSEIATFKEFQLESEGVLQ